MKTKKTTIFNSVMLLALFLSVSFVIKPDRAEASHFRYGHLTWVPVAGSPNTARFTLVDAFRRNAYGAPVVGSIITENTGATRLFFGDGSSTGTLQYKVLAFDATGNWIVCQALQPGSTTKTTIDKTYAGPTNGGVPWVAEINSGARTGIEMNNPNGGYQVSTLVELSSGNSSPSSALPPIVNLARSASASFLVPGADADPNTQITYRLATSAEAGGAGGFVQPPGLAVDANTGLVTWNNLFTAIGQLWSSQIVIEDRDATTGALRTQVAVDYLIEIVDCDPTNQAPVFVSPSPANGSVFTVLAGNPLQFQVDASDSDVGNTVILNTTGIPSGASLTPGLPASGNPVSTVFNWTPTAADAGTYIVSFFAADDCGSQTLIAYTVNVINCEAPTISCPGDQTSAVNTSGCSANVNFPAATVTGFPAPTVTYSPAGPYPVGTTTVTATATNTCGSASCTFDVVVTSDLSVNAGSDEQTYFGYVADQSVTHTAIALGGGGGNSFSWSLSRSILCNQVNGAGDEAFTGGSCTNNICPSVGSPAVAPNCSGSASVTAKLIEDADACVTVTDQYGCVATDCFSIDAIDARCYAGNSGNVKVKVCHSTNSTSNPWVQICIAQSAVATHIAENHGDYIGTCGSRLLTSAGNPVEMMVYPNPANDVVNVEFSSMSTENYQLAIFDITGRMVLISEGITFEEGNRITLPIQNIAKGVYSIKLSVGDVTSLTKFVVSK
jgi:Secretion system C-terminal sorting domain